MNFQRTGLYQLRKNEAIRRTIRRIAANKDGSYPEAGMCAVVYVALVACASDDGGTVVLNEGDLNAFVQEHWHSLLHLLTEVVGADQMDRLAVEFAGGVR
jgi:hypothetical protein